MNSQQRLIHATGYRGKVERLLEGQIHSDDLHDLFFMMRAESSGSGLVSEIGDFIAHPDMRTQGLVWREMRDAFAFLKFRLTLGSNSIITRDLPGNAAEALRGNLRRFKRAVLQEWTNLNRNQAEAMLNRILARQVPTGVGRASRLEIRSAEEQKLIECLASNIRGGSIFKDNDLFEDFCRALMGRGWLQQTEKQTLKQVKPALTLFAATKMHKRKIDLGDGTVADLVLHADIRRNVGIFAASEAAENRGSGATIGHFWVFETGLPISDYCAPDVAPIDRSPFIGDFKLSPQGLLVRTT